MTSEELLQKVRKIEIKTHGLSRNIFAGEYHSQFKGRGMAFSEVREYQPGDDVRSIDWNVTARLNKPYIKVYEEERELTVMLLVDVSGSRNFGTISQFKRDSMAEIAATLAFSTIENNDKVGIIFFSDKIADKAAELRELCPTLSGFVSMGEGKVDFATNLESLVSAGKLKHESGDRSYYDYQIDDLKLSSIVFTSGTTGKGKGVMLSQTNFISDLTDVIPFIDFSVIFRSIRREYDFID